MNKRKAASGRFKGKDSAAGRLFASLVQGAGRDKRSGGVIANACAMTVASCSRAPDPECLGHGAPLP